MFWWSAYYSCYYSCKDISNVFSISQQNNGLIPYGNYGTVLTDPDCRGANCWIKEQPETPFETRGADSWNPIIYTWRSSCNLHRSHVHFCQLQDSTVRSRWDGVTNTSVSLSSSYLGVKNIFWIFSSTQCLILEMPEYLKLDISFCSVDFPRCKHKYCFVSNLGWPPATSDRLRQKGPILVIFDSTPVFLSWLIVYHSNY